MPKKKARQPWKATVGSRVEAQVNGISCIGTVQRIAKRRAEIKFSGPGWEFRKELSVSDLFEDPVYNPA